MVWIVLNIGVVIFCIMNIVFYYLIPSATSGANYIKELIEELQKVDSDLIVLLNDWNEQYADPYEFKAEEMYDDKKYLYLGPG